MSSVLYHSVVPENNKASYSEYDVVDFVLSHPGRMMACNALRLTGKVLFKQGGAAVTTQKLQMDKFVGGHSFFQSIQTFVGGQSIDNIGMEYPRIVKMLTAASECNNDMNMASNVCELKAATNAMAQALTRKITTESALGTVVYEDIDFSVKPMIALNQVFGERMYLSYQKSGDIRLSVAINRNANVFLGEDQDINSTFTLEDLRVEYYTLEDDGDMSPILYKKRQLLKQSFQSQNASLNFNFPMVADRVYGSFLNQFEESAYKYNNFALQQPPVVKEVTFLWNNATNQFISYQLKSHDEILERAIDAIGDTGKNQCNTTALANNNGFLIGLNLGENLDMMASRLTVNIESELNSAEPYLLFMVSEGLASL